MLKKEHAKISFTLIWCLKHGSVRWSVFYLKAFCNWTVGVFNVIGVFNVFNVFAVLCRSSFLVAFFCKKNHFFYFEVFLTPVLKISWNYKRWKSPFKNWKKWNRFFVFIWMNGKSNKSVKMIMTRSITTHKSQTTEPLIANV